MCQCVVLLLYTVVVLSSVVADAATDIFQDAWTVYSSPRLLNVALSILRYLPIFSVLSECARAARTPRMINTFKIPSCTSGIAAFPRSGRFSFC